MKFAQIAMQLQSDGIMELKTGGQGKFGCVPLSFAYPLWRHPQFYHIPI